MTTTPQGGIVKLKNKCFAVSVLLCALTAGVVANADIVRRVGAEDLVAATCGFGLRPQAGKSVRGRPLCVAGNVYENGIGMIPEGAVGFKSDGNVVAFDALVGIDDGGLDFKTTTNRKAKAEFRVWADGRVVRSVSVREGQKPVALHADLAGAKEIVLETKSCAPWIAIEY